MLQPRDSSPQNLVLSTVRRWRSQPETMVRELFGVSPDPWQVEALTALATRGRVSIRACHGPGKSALDAWAIYWFMLTRFPTRIPCTAPTSHQLSDILWAELHKWHQAMQPAFREMFRLSAEKVEWAAAPNESFAVARTSRPEKPEALQGFHCEHLLFVLDEASGIPDNVFEVAEGALSADNAMVLMTANPTRVQGYFHRSHHQMRHRWHTMRVSHEDSPRVSQAYVQDMADAYGADSNVYRVRVLGEFPLEDDDAVISLELAESALSRDVADDHSAPVVWGIDVARFGDDRTALVRRRGPVVLSTETWQGKDLMQTSGLIYDAYNAEMTVRKPDKVCVDAIGLGAGVADRLKELGLPVTAVNVAEAPSVKERFMRLRDELWFDAREWLEGRACRLDSDELVAELTGPTYAMTSSGKIKVEDKDSMKSRGLRSPDIADAFCLTFARAAKRRSSAPLTYAHHKAVV